MGVEIQKPSYVETLHESRLLLAHSLAFEGTSGHDVCDILEWALCTLYGVKVRTVCPSVLQSEQLCVPYKPYQFSTFNLYFLEFYQLVLTNNHGDGGG